MNSSLFSPRSLGFVFAIGLTLALAAGWTYVANYNFFFFHGDRAHIMQGMAIFLLADLGCALSIVSGCLGFFLYPGRRLWLIYKNGREIGNLLYKRERCEHDWQPDPDRSYNSAKRYCPKCGRRQSLFQRPYPSTSAPSLSWHDQNFDELRRL